MLDIRNLSFGFDSHVVLDAVSLQVEPDEIVCLLGPSGCGKTTLLRIVAGLLEDFSGTIRFAEENLHQVAVNERGFGLMFQDFALFPHMTVAENIAYGLKRQSIKREIIAERVRLMLKRVGLEGFEDRDVSALSGGEKQRVALARSLAPQPRFLMLDEPLGSLDALLRDQLAQELREIIKDAGLSAIYVTHDHREAYAIADRIAVMAAGTIGQVAEPVELYQRPASENVARFLGLSNIFRFGDNLLYTSPRDACSAGSHNQPYVLDSSRRCVSTAATRSAIVSLSRKTRISDLPWRSPRGASPAAARDAPDLQVRGNRVGSRQPDTSLYRRGFHQAVQMNCRFFQATIRKP